MDEDKGLSPTDSHSFDEELSGIKSMRKSVPEMDLAEENHLQAEIVTVESRLDRSIMSREPCNMLRPMRKEINSIGSLEALLQQLQRMPLLRQLWAAKCTHTECQQRKEAYPSFCMR